MPIGTSDVFRGFSSLCNSSTTMTWKNYLHAKLSQDLIVNICDQVGKDEKDCKLEAHKDYIDIHIPLTASETMLWSSLEDCQSVLKEYDEGRDVEIYSDRPSARFSVPRGYFAVFFPTDAHASGVASSTFRKIIVKAKVE